MNRNQALRYLCHIVDTALSTDTVLDRDRATLVGWQCGFEPMFVAIQDAYIYEEGRTIIGEEEATELAIDYLKEIDWFSGNVTEPDYIILPGGNDESI